MATLQCSQCDHGFRLESRLSAFSQQSQPAVSSACSSRDSLGSRSLLYLSLSPSSLSLMETAGIWSLPASCFLLAPHIFFMVFIAENWATGLFDMKHNVLIRYLLSPWQPCDQWCWLPPSPLPQCCAAPELWDFCLSDFPQKRWTTCWCTPSYCVWMTFFTSRIMAASFCLLL